MNTLILKDKNHIKSDVKPYLYNYIFWFNPYENLWYVIKADTQINFFNGNRKKSIYYTSREISLLIEFLEREYDKTVQS